MTRQVRKLKYAILIVCEGTASEPNYFNGLKQEAEEIKDDFHEIKVIIDPVPQEELEIEAKASLHKSARKKRKLQHRVSVITDEVEEEFRAIPVCYVRTAQFGLEDGTYDEAYAVFDMDGERPHADAFALAANEINGKRVHIGFSSISFETWILLHFEMCTEAYVKSECKDDKKRYLGCGKEGNLTGCNGNRCVAGHLRKNGYLDYSKGDSVQWFSLRGRLQIACRNAAYLRHQIQVANPDQEIYGLNPYCDVDMVIAKILRLRTYVMIGIGETYFSAGVGYQVTCPAGGREVRLKVTNDRNASTLFKTGVYFSDESQLDVGQMKLSELIPPDAAKIFSIAIPVGLQQSAVRFYVEICENKVVMVPLVL